MASVQEWFFGGAEFVGDLLWHAVSGFENCSSQKKADVGADEALSERGSRLLIDDD